jgi:hypothetical protein
MTRTTKRRQLPYEVRRCNILNTSKLAISPTTCILILSARNRILFVQRREIHRDSEKHRHTRILKLRCTFQGDLFHELAIPFHLESLGTDMDSFACRWGQMQSERRRSSPCDQKWPCRAMHGKTTSQRSSSVIARICTVSPVRNQFCFLCS